MARRILAIDGGGIRGIIPAVVISHIEKQVGKSAAECFDLMVGTSTGGILRSALLGLGQAAAHSFQQSGW